MVALPITERAVLVRTDFSDDSIWQAVCAAVAEPGPEMMQAFDIIKMVNAHLHDADETDVPPPSIEILEDVQLSGATPEQLLGKLPDN